MCGERGQAQGVGKAQRVREPWKRFIVETGYLRVDSESCRRILVEANTLPLFNSPPMRGKGRNAYCSNQPALTGTHSCPDPGRLGGSGLASRNTMLGEIEELFENQIRVWPQLAKGVEGLARARTRRVRIDWFDIFVRHIPHRMASTTAVVDRASVAKRPCFLCAANLPPEQQGAPFNEDFTVYCNPFPIVDRHLTIIHREHRLQRIANQFGNMLDLAAALPGYFVIYNGPECGASAPDHMHFQAGSRKLFPIEKDTAGLAGLTVPNYQRNVFVFHERNRSGLIGQMDHTVSLLAEATGRRPEPLVNIAAFHEGEEWTVYLFPRDKHRPAAFHTGELMVSPASIDLCGILVVPRARDFERITGDAIAKILEEITLPDAEFRAIVKALERTL
jgi:hypothetical protein